MARIKYYNETTQQWEYADRSGSNNSGAGVTATTLWEGRANITSNSSSASVGSHFDAESYDYYEVTVEYGGYYLDKTAVRCYTVNTTQNGAAISGHLSWYASYWLSLDMMIYADGTARLGCIFRDIQSTVYTLGSQTFTITKIVGYKLG